MESPTETILRLEKNSLNSEIRQSIQNTFVARWREDREFLLSHENGGGWRIPPSAKYPPDQVENWPRAEQTRELSTFARGTKIAGPAERRRASVEKEKSPSSSCTRVQRLGLYNYSKTYYICIMIVRQRANRTSQLEPQPRSGRVVKGIK